MRFSLFANAINLVESVLMLSPVLSYILPGVQPQSSGWSGYRGAWDLAGGLLARIWPTTSLLAHSLSFVIVLTAIDAITSIPASAYKTFVLEAKHGFNKTTPRTFVLDLVKGWAIGAVIGLPVIAGLVRIIEWAGGPGFVKWVMLGVCVLLQWSEADRAALCCSSRG